MYNSSCALIFVQLTINQRFVNFLILKKSRPQPTFLKKSPSPLFVFLLHFRLTFYFKNFHQKQPKNRKKSGGHNYMFYYFNYFIYFRMG